MLLFLPIFVKLDHFFNLTKMFCQIILKSGMHENLFLPLTTFAIASKKFSRFINNFKML